MYKKEDNKYYEIEREKILILVWMINRKLFVKIQLIFWENRSNFMIVLINKRISNKREEKQKEFNLRIGFS
jgi:hypothetical protein